MVAEDDFPGQGSLAVTKEDSSQARHNVSINWRDLFVLNKQNESKAMICLIALVSISIVLLLKASKYVRKVTEVVPESGMLVITGALISLTLKLIFPEGFNSVHIEEGYLVILIAPIILHASYTLYHPHFFGQIGTILIMAFLATTLNVLVITPVVSGVYTYGLKHHDFNLFDSVTYASLISAVDPVAVLAVFDDVKADKRLYYLIFGESLLNDGVTFVLFEGFRGLTYPVVEISDVPYKSYGFIFGSFVTAPLGGIVVGYAIGVLAAIVSKWTEGNFVMIVTAVLSYTVAAIFGFSSIISLIVYGITQERYTFDNMKIRQQIDANLIVSNVATVFETILFLLIGYEMVHRYEDFLKYFRFCLVVFLAITIARLVVTLALVFVLNRFRTEPIDFKWQTIIFLGGLRGAVAYMMVSSYSPEYEHAKMLKITTIFIIVLTTLLNGIVTKPLVVFFGLKQDKPEVTMPEEYTEEYARVRESCFFRAWYWWEDNVILPLISRSSQGIGKRRDVEF